MTSEENPGGESKREIGASWDPYEVWLRRVKQPREMTPVRTLPVTAEPRPAVVERTVEINRDPKLLAQH